MNRRAVCWVAALAAVAAAAPPARGEGVRLRALAGIYADSGGGGLREPEGVAPGAEGRVAVADTGNGRIVEFVAAGERAEARAAYAVPELPRPLRLAVGPARELYVLDGKLRRIGRVAEGGSFRGYVDLPPRAVPRSLRVDREGRLWVLDVGGFRVLALDAAGAVVRDLALPGEPARAFYSDLALGAHGEVFVLDSVGRRVLAAKAGGSEFTPFGGPLNEDLDFGTALAVDEAGRVFVADQNGGGIVVLGADGSFRGRQSAMGWKEGMLRYPSAIAVVDGRLYVADRGNNRIEVFAIGP